MAPNRTFLESIESLLDSQNHASYESNNGISEPSSFYRMIAGGRRFVNVVRDLVVRLLELATTLDLSHE